MSVALRLQGPPPATRPLAAVQSTANLVALADPATVTTPEALLVRLRQLEVGLAGDGRVVFPAVYVAITKAAIRWVADGGAKDHTTARALIVDFGRRYLSALKADLQGDQVIDHWRRHFEVAERGPSLRAATSAINAHLTVDLAESLAAVSAGGHFAGDFTAFGDALADATDDVIASLGRHGVKADGLLRGGFVGRALDAVTGPGTTSRLGFQTIRREAFTNAQALLHCTEHPGVIRAGMAAAARAREATLDVVLGR
jgi:hypothetical protein